MSGLSQLSRAAALPARYRSPPPAAAARSILRLAQVAAGDCVYDLGCGDGRICLAAAKLGASAVGVEIEPDLARSFSRQIEAQGLGEKVRCVCGDLRELDPAELERATVLVVYLLPEAIAGLQTRLLECVQRGARLVCNTWGLVGVAAAGETNVADKGATKLWLYTKAGCEKASS